MAVENERLGRVFVDLCARPPTVEDAINMLALYSRLNYKIVAIEKSPWLDTARIEKAASDAGVQVIWRRTLRASRPREIQRQLRDSERGEIVAVAAETLEAARFAARNKRVHILTVSPGMERIVDRSTLILFQQRGWGVVEVHLLPVLAATMEPERRLDYTLRAMFTIFRRAVGYNLPLVISSCSNSPWLLPHPLHIIGLAALGGIPEEVSIQWVTVNPLSVISRVNLGSGSQAR
ncbi:MAG: hypothetical protein F7C35_01150 [Desulfurococcales archaeon]|nr:hypothetical protein [Desulfurococcales archaeon]